MRSGEERLVVLDRVVKSVIGGVRGAHPELVFVRKTKRGIAPMHRMNNFEPAGVVGVAISIPCGILDAARSSRCFEQPSVQ